MIAEILPNVVSEYTKINNEKLVISLESEFRKASPKDIIAVSRGMAERLDHSDFIKEIKVPTLLIFGTEDEITDLNTAKALSRQIKTSTLATIQNAGHYSNIEQPEIFNKWITTFLENIK